MKITADVAAGLPAIIDMAMSVGEAERLLDMLWAEAGASTSDTAERWAQRLEHVLQELAT